MATTMGSDVQSPSATAPLQRVPNAKDLAIIAPFAVLFAFAALKMGRAAAVSANSDSLYLAGLYRDLFVDHMPVSGWTLQPASSFFPDLPVYFLLRVVTTSPVVALGAYAVVQLLVGVACIVAIARILEVDRRVAVWSAALLAMAAFAYFNSFGDFFNGLMAPSCHQSCAWASTATALLVAHQVKSARASAPALSVIVLVSALMESSDGLYALHAAGLVAAVAFCLLILPGARIVAGANLLALSVGTWLGHELSGIPSWFGMTIPTPDGGVRLTWQQLLHTLGLLPPPEHDLATLSIDGYVLALATLLALAVALIAASGLLPTGGRTRALVFFAASFVGVMACVFFGAAYTTSYWNDECARYLQALLVLPYVALPIAWLVGRRALLRVAIPSGLALLLVFVGWPKSSPKRLAALAEPATYPRSIACIDEVARRHAARFGYGNYWSARRTTELSKAGLHVLGLTKDAKEHHHIANLGWYPKAAPAASFFVLMDGMKQPGTRAVFGEPSQVETCGDQEIWLYSQRRAPSPPKS